MKPKTIRLVVFALTLTVMSLVGGLISSTSVDASQAGGALAGASCAVMYCTFGLVCLFGGAAIAATGGAASIAVAAVVVGAYAPLGAATC
jgi:hypothetical protein